MSIRDLELAKELRQQGERLGREGLSQRSITVVREFNKDPSYKAAMILAGRMKAIAQAAKCDGYWSEIVSRGFEPELRDITNFQKVPTDEFNFDITPPPQPPSQTNESGE